jgi:LppX/LprAFG-like lipoprotein
MRFLFLLAAPLALGAVSCGGTASLDPVAQAATNSTRQSSEHMTLTGRISAGGQHVTMTGDGDFSNDPSRGAMTMTVSMRAHSYTMRTIMDKKRVYLSSDLFKAVLPAGKTWLSLDLAKAASALGTGLGSAPTQSPASVLAQLKSSGRVAKIGTDTIDAVHTTHYRGVVDSKRISKIEKALHTTVSYEPFDVWIDGQGLVRRLTMSYSQSASATVPTASSIVTTISFSNYGENVATTVPSADETFDATNLATSAIGNGGTP